MRLTPLHDLHVEIGARMTEFEGWELPLSYDSVIDEVLSVRQRAGLFDVSHMGRIEVAGTEALPLLQRLTTNNVARLDVGRGQYSLMCNEIGGILDDLTVFRTGEQAYLLTVNAANTHKDFAHLAAEQTGQVKVRDVTAETVLFALQGPASTHVISAVTGGAFTSLSRFQCGDYTIADIGCAICRAGYTGEVGYEVRCSGKDAASIWEALMAAGPNNVTPCGLAARDVLRIEAGFVLYGHEIDEDTNPIEAGLTRLVHMGKGDFTGREAFADILRRGPQRTLVGIRMADRTVPRAGASVLAQSQEIGVVTSGTFSPTIKQGIALAFIRFDANQPGLEVEVVLREKPHTGLIVKPPFY